MEHSKKVRLLHALLLKLRVRAGYLIGQFLLDTFLNKNLDLSTVLVFLL